MALADADYGDGRAIKTDESVGVNDDVEQVEKSSDDASAVGLVHISTRCLERDRHILTVWVCWQHWIGPVLQLPSVAAPGVGVATAKAMKKRMTATKEAETRANMLKTVVKRRKSCIDDLA